jgi:hypothetical protein
MIDDMNKIEEKILKIVAEKNFQVTKMILETKQL